MRIARSPGAGTGRSGPARRPNFRQRRGLAGCGLRPPLGRQQQLPTSQPSTAQMTSSSSSLTVVGWPDTGRHLPALITMPAFGEQRCSSLPSRCRGWRPPAAGPLHCQSLPSVGRRAAGRDPGVLDVRHVDVITGPWFRSRRDSSSPMANRPSPGRGRARAEVPQHAGDRPQAGSAGAPRPATANTSASPVNRKNIQALAPEGNNGARAGVVGAKLTPRPR